jgi:DNA-binding NtrC family response regulator
VLVFRIGLTTQFSEKVLIKIVCFFRSVFELFGFSLKLWRKADLGFLSPRVVLARSGGWRLGHRHSVPPRCLLTTHADTIPPMTCSLLLVDDDLPLLHSMTDWLRDQGFQVTPVDSLEQAAGRLRAAAFGMILCDIRLGHEDGLDLLQIAQQHAPQTPVVMMSGYADAAMVDHALNQGAFDFLTKPLMDQELMLVIRRAIDHHRVQEENRRLRAELDRRLGFEHIISHDLRMLDIFDTIDSVADTRASVLITGENGTGKSMIARAIHHRSSRSDGPFVEVACGALPDTLLESELFGHEAGAFTGASQRKLGKFSLADGGTLFLDEIGTATQALQVKLLRVLQEQQFEMLGGTQTLQVDARLVLATNEDLELAVSEGRFRQDLYYRINVIHLDLPPLRERRDDIPLLADRFLKAAASEYGRNVEGFTPQAIDALYRHRWPGNIRELQNVVQRSVLLTKQALVGAEVLPPGLLAQAASVPGAPPEAVGGALVPVAVRQPDLRAALAEPERRLILQALSECGGNRSLAAQKLGINRTTLYKKMKRLGLPRTAAATSGR